MQPPNWVGTAQSPTPPPIRLNPLRLIVCRLRVPHQRVLAVLSSTLLWSFNSWVGEEAPLL